MKIIILLLLLIAIPLGAQSNLLKMEKTKSTPFVMTINAASVTMSMKGTGSIKAVWGDGTSTDYTLTSTAQNVTHNYSGSALYTVRLYNSQKITSWVSSDNVNYVFNLRELKKTGITSITISNSNAIYGDVADLKANLTDIRIQGSNIITGNVADFKTGLTDIYITGSNTIYGDIADFKAGLVSIRIQGLTTITGDVANFKAGLVSIAFLGSNTIYGNVANFKAGLVSIQIQGSNAIAGYTSPHSWPNLINFVYLITSNGAGLTAEEVDNICIDLDGSAWGGSGKTLRLTGTAIAAPTATSAAARASLQAKGVNITTN